MYQEQLVIEKVKSLLPKDFTIETIRQSSNRPCPDAIISYKYCPIALVEIKTSLPNKQIISHAAEVLRSYNKVVNASDLVIITEDQAIVIPNEGQFDYGLNLLTPLENYIHSMVHQYSQFKQVDVDKATLIKTYLIEAFENSYVQNEKFQRYVEGIDLPYLIEHVTEIRDGSFVLDSSFEQKLMFELIGTVENEVFCRYTSISSCIRILQDQKASVCSIVCMNDKSECYYVDQYLNGEKGERLLSDMSDAEVEDLNQYFIMSCSEIDRYDKLTMWRMYGDEAKGVCIEYHINDILKSDSKFFLAPVSYGKKDGIHPELDFLKRLGNGTQIKIILQNMNLWKHFFKPYDYIDENEIRLLYQDSDKTKYKWIISGDGVLCPVIEFCIEQGKNMFPLTIEAITLGPKSRERHTNVAQLKLFAKEKKIESYNGKIGFKLSKIDNYR